MAIQRTSDGRGQTIGLWVGAVGFLLLMALPIDAANVPASRLAAVAFLMAAWWVSDAIPLFATMPPVPGSTGSTRIRVWSAKGRRRSMGRTVRSTQSSPQTTQSKSLAIVFGSLAAPDNGRLC